MFPLEVIAVLLVGYLLGSIPFAVILAKQRGVDVYSVGSGNPGATNVTRHVGKWIGRVVFVLDFLKGLLATQWFRWDFLVEPSGNPEFLGMCGMIAAVVGHSYPVFSRFRGGKGVATTMGALIYVMQPAMAVGLLVWAGLFFSLRYVSLASIGFGLSLPITVFFVELFREEEGHYVKVAFALALALWILFRHRSNLSR
ncbi:MAG: glycerol-3-phosphate 1-O-acyltransferase PlsY, partial [Opitutales bacterium]